MVYLQKRFWHLTLGTSLLALLVIMILGITVGPANITFLETFKLLCAKIPFLSELVEIDSYPKTHYVIVYQVRMPRVISAALVGAALTAVGTALQSMFKNPMADPYVIGVSSGAALGAAIAIFTGSANHWGFWTLPAAAFLGALFATWLVYGLARVGSKVPVYTLLLAGVALSSTLGAVTSFLMIFHADELHQIIFWMLGSFAAINWLQVKAVAPLVVVGTLGLCFFAKDLNVMLFGEDTARSLGLDIEKVKKLLLILAAVTVSAAVSVSGTVGFVGLIIPNIVRLLVGPDHRVLLPLATTTGAAFMVIADTVARTALAPTEIPVGIITAFCGGPFFIYLLKRNKSGLY